MVVDMYKFYQMFKKNDLDIIYSGPLWSDEMEQIADTLRRRMNVDEMSLSAKQAIFSVFVEQMNNMLMYSKDEEEDTSAESEAQKVSKGVFILGAQGKTYFLESGNVMKSEHVELVKGRIDYLNTLDKKQLREFYKKQLRKANTNPESKGGGLGLIEIAKRAKQPIKYEFRPMENGFTFFTMYVII